MLPADYPMYLVVQEQSQILVVLDASVEGVALGDELRQYLNDVLAVRAAITSRRPQCQLLPLLIILYLDVVVGAIEDFLGGLRQHHHLLLVLVLLESYARVESPHLERLAPISEVHLGRNVAQHRQAGLELETVDDSLRLVRILDVVRELLEILLKLVVLRLERAERGETLLLGALVSVDLGLLAEHPLAAQVGTLHYFGRNIALTSLIFFVANLL